MEDEDILNEATKRVQAKKGFFRHLITYVGVLGMLYAIMYFENNGEFLPVVIVALSWGIALAIHYFNTFGTEHLEILGLSSNWEEEELEKEIEKLKRNKGLKEQTNQENNLLNNPDKLELKEIEKKTLDRDTF